MRTLGLAKPQSGGVWKKIASCLALGMLWGSTCGATSIMINANNLNVRQSPEGPKVGKAIQGAQFVVLEQKKDWLKINFEPGKIGWVKQQFTKPVGKLKDAGKLAQFCQKVNDEFKKIKWTDIQCRPEEWNAEMTSVLKSPLIYQVFGKQKTTSLLICSVHSDEYTPYQCFQLAQILMKQPELLNQRVVIAPLVNPDGFLAPNKLRTNARGVDLNRNMPTQDWWDQALPAWKGLYSSDKRRFPGASANSEPENQFVIDLIQRFSPDKVISIHAPLNFLDLDYLDLPAYSQNSRDILQKAQELAVRFSKESKITLVNYKTFPGSLGRYGDDWGVPIYTLELPTSNAAMAKEYFQRVKQSLVYSFNIILDTRRTAQTESKQAKNIN